MFNDGESATYNAVDGKFVTNEFGFTKTGTPNANGAFEVTDFGASFAQKVDNSVAGEMRDCGECHVGGGMMEYVNNTIPAASVPTTGVKYDPAKRTSLRTYAFGAAKTAFNTLIDIFNPDEAKRGDVLVQNYAETGVLEMDCLMCHQSGYDWSERKHAVRKGEFDASRALGSKLATRALNGTTVFYNTTTVKANTTTGFLTVDLSTKLNGTPASEQCNSCHQGRADEKYQVEWKKRGEMWSTLGSDGKPVYTDVHASIGCMGCHERMDKGDGTIGTDGKPGTAADAKLGLCDPAKGGNSPFEALWNQLDGKQFKDCAGCHEPKVTPTHNTFGAPISQRAHEWAGLNAPITYKADGTKVSHIDLIDCTACHVKKDGFSGGAFVDGTGADEEGRLAVHDTEFVAKADMKDGTALKWGADGKIHAANLLTSFFWRDMNGLKGGVDGGLDINNDGRTAGMDPILPTHVRNMNAMRNTAFGTYSTPLQALTHDGKIDAAEIKIQQDRFVAQVRGQAGITTTQATNPAILKLSFLLVPFKTSHNIGGADKAWGKKGCKECHSVPGTVIAAGDADNRSGVAYAGGGFYNGAYPINGNMQGNFTFDSDQITTYTKVNGLVDVTDSHPNVINKKATRTVAIPVITKFDNPYAQTVTAGQSLRNVDRSEVLYEKDFKTRDEKWYDANAATPEFILGGAISSVCNADGKSPFYCNGAILTKPAKHVATSTLGWTMKIEISPSAGGAVTTRTVQVMNDKVTTVEELVTALGADYTTNNPDFTIVAVNAATGLPKVDLEVNNALKIIPAAGKKIRIHALSDVGPFGLAGKLWMNDSIVRTDAGGNTLTFTTRDTYVAYLNAITKTSAGMAPTAMIASIGGKAATGGTTLVTVDKGVTDLVVASPNENLTYTWSVDGVALAADATTVNFTKTGIRRLTLTATAADGSKAQTTQRVTVVAPVIISTVNITDTAAVNNVVDSGIAIPEISFVGNPTHTKVKISWGDGSFPTTVLTAGNVPAQTHQFKLLERYKSGSNYVFKTIIQLFNGAAVVSSKAVTVTVTP